MKKNMTRREALKKLAVGMSVVAAMPMDLLADEEMTPGEVAIYRYLVGEYKAGKTSQQIADANNTSGASHQYTAQEIEKLYNALTKKYIQKTLDSSGGSSYNNSSTSYSQSLYRPYSQYSRYVPYSQYSKSYTPSPPYIRSNYSRYLFSIARGHA